MLRYLVLLGIAVQLIGVLSYAKATIQGTTKPNRVTWLMWSIAPLVAAAAGFASGVTWAVLPVFMAGFAPLLVLIASFVNRHSYWKLESFDFLCGFFSLLALILWGITRNPDVAIIFAIANDGCAAIPTLIKGWKYPRTEAIAPFTTGIFGALTSFFAITMWTFSSYAFPVYLVLINALLTLAISRKHLPWIR